MIFRELQMIFRELQITDYDQFSKLINIFSKTYFSFDQFKDFLENEKNTKIYVLEDNNILLACGTILFEKKFIHNLSLYAHIEDIIVCTKYQKKGYGKLLIQNLINICKERKCYKILLDCNNNFIPSYEKYRFIPIGYQMVIYL